MNVITVSREYGAGGYEVAHLLAEQLGWELLDRELLHRAAAIEHLPDAELERLDEKAVSLADRFRLHPPHQRYLHGLTEAARQAAARGNVVLVGRGTGHLLADFPHTLHLRLVAPLQWRAQRMASKEGWSPELALARCAEQDSTRERFNRYFFGEAPFQLWRYDLTFHTGRVQLGDVAACVAAVIRGEINGPPLPAAGPRVLTLSRELAACEDSLVASLAARLGLTVCDRELLDQEAQRLGVSKAEVEKVDEQPAGIFQRFRPGNLSQRYFETLGQIVTDLAARGNVLLVGRGGNFFLRDHPGAFHVRLAAPPLARVRRMMEHHWMREAPARAVLVASDNQRRRFCEGYFDGDWADPLQYHQTVNAARLGPAAVGAIVQAAVRHWEHSEVAASGQR
jgi:cytidylate kinase